MFDNFEEEDTFKSVLRDKFIEQPFSVLDTKSGSWQKRKRAWKKLGIKSEIGRDAEVFGGMATLLAKTGRSTTNVISIFDPVLCEVLYNWFCPEGGTILDPFSGGSVRGIVANYLGYKYTGIDIRKEQIDSNQEQALEILEKGKQPTWITGDSNLVLDTIDEKFDLVFSCPPYADLEVYSDLEGDISNMNYDEFLEAYRGIIAKSCNLLKEGGYACFIVGEVRGKTGDYLGFVPDTIKAFNSCGMHYYNEAMLLNCIGSATIRANNTMKNQKLVKIHQNILIFKKGSTNV